MIGRTVDMDDIVLILLNECTQFQTIYDDARQFLEFSGIVQVDQNACVALSCRNDTIRLALRCTLRF